MSYHHSTSTHSRPLEALLALIFLTGICVVSYSIYDKVTREPRSETVCFKFSVSSAARNDRGSEAR